MIGKIGAKKTFIIGGLVVLMVAFFLLSEYLIKPKAMEAKQKLNTAQAELSTLTADIQKMQTDFVTFEKQREFYEVINKIGFFNDQDRILARERFDTMQKLSKIISAKYEIKAANLLTEDAPPETGFVVMQSPITVSLSAVDDIDIYKFIYYLNYGFPGHITINSLNVERKQEVTPELLKQIGSGAPTEIVAAQLELDWRTMARKDSVQPQATEPATQPASATGGAQ